MWKFSLSSIFLLLLIAVTVAKQIPTFPDQLGIYVLDVGQGDATLVHSPDNLWMLIDTGPDNTVVQELANVPGLSNRIDILILTHPDADHIAGTLKVLQHFQIGTVLWTKTSKQSNLYHQVKTEIARLQIPNYIVNAHHDFRFGCCVDVDIVWPLPGMDTFSMQDANDASVGIKMRFRKFDYYTAGDLGGEYELASTSECTSDCNMDVLKAGHHGSRTSSGLDFLQMIDPELVIISDGKDNSYGHPHAEVLDNLAKIGAEVRRTDLNGTITIFTDGYTEYEVKVENLLENLKMKL